MELVLVITYAILAFTGFGGVTTKLELVLAQLCGKEGLLKGDPGLIGKVGLKLGVILGDFLKLFADFGNLSKETLVEGGRELFAASIGDSLGRDRVEEADELALFQERPSDAVGVHLKRGDDDPLHAAMEEVV